MTSTYTIWKKDAVHFVGLMETWHTLEGAVTALREIEEEEPRLRGQLVVLETPQIATGS